MALLRKFSSLDIEEAFHELLNSSAELSGQKTEEPLILYGSGDMGRMALKYFNFVGVHVEAFCDASVGLEKTEFVEGLRVFHPSQVSAFDKTKHLVICIGKVSYADVMNSLEPYNFEKISHFYQLTGDFTSLHPLNNGWILRDTDRCISQKIKNNIARLGDYISVAHYIQFLAWHKFNQDWLFEGALVNVNDRFFPQFLISEILASEVFVDVGAYHGLVSERFLSVIQHGRGKIYAFEPDQVNLAVLKERLRPYMLKSHVEITQACITEKNGDCSFISGLGYCSQPFASGTARSKCLKIDDLNLQPDYMKFHLEGHELNALKGAIDTIIQHKPLVAVTIYHDLASALDIIEYLANSVSGYEIKLRLHGWVGTGLVLYLIPNKQDKHWHITEWVNG